MTSAVNNYSYGSTAGNDLPSSVKKIQENPENFRLYMAQFGNSIINSLNSSAVYDENSSSGDGTDSLFSSLGASSSSQSLSLDGTSSSYDPLSSLFSSTSASSGSDFSMLLNTPSLDSYKVSETLAELQKYSDVSETKRWVGQMVSYIDPSDKVTKSGLVSKVLVENVEKPILIIDGQKINIDDMVSIDVGSQTV